MSTDELYSSFIKTPLADLPLKVKQEFYAQATEFLASGDQDGLREIWDEHDNAAKIVLWGLFNSQERKTMRKFLSNT